MTLVAKPGFLYDRLWAATLIGLNESGFKKLDDIFRAAKYNGVFADKTNERWWQSELRKIVFSKVPNSSAIYPWEIGRQLPGVEQGDFSKCYVSGEDYPETVAFTDETAKHPQQMKMKFTVPHPRFSNSLYFEEMRMMKPAE